MTVYVFNLSTQSPTRESRSGRPARLEVTRLVIFSDASTRRHCVAPRGTARAMSVHVHRPASLPGVAVVVIDSPKTVNAITQVMLLSLAKAFRDLRVDRSVRAAVLTATGRRAFSTGIDLGDAERVFKMDESRLDDDIVHQMELCPFPIIGAVNGVAINAGFELALACLLLLLGGVVAATAGSGTHAATGRLEDSFHA